MTTTRLSPKSLDAPRSAAPDSGSFARGTFGRLGALCVRFARSTGEEASVATALAVAAHALIWSLGAWAVVDSLHVDSLEIVGWANDWSLIYPKHPPLAAWLAKIAVAAPGPGLPAILILSQALVAVSAALVWRIVRLYARGDVAAMATIGFLASPPASIFAIQFNHNLVLIPFALAATLFALRFFEGRRTLDVVGADFFAGLAMLAKYEAAIILLALIALSLVVARMRGVWRDPRALLGMAAFAAVFSPHLVAERRHGWPTLTYAEAARPLHDFGDVLESLNQLFDGLLYIAIAAVLTALAFRGRVAARAAVEGRPRLGAFLVAAPIAVLIVLSLATMQVIRQGWLLPLAPFAVIGLSLYAASRLTIAPAAWGQVLARVVLASLLQLVALQAFFLVRDVRGKPIASYAFDGSEMSETIEAIWAERSTAALPCLAAPSRSEAQSPLISIEAKPRFVDLAGYLFDAASPPCAATGGLATAPAGFPAPPSFARLKLTGRPITVTSESHLGGYLWRFDVYAIPPP